MSLFKEDGDLALRPHVLVNSLLFRERRDGEPFTFRGKPLSESYAAVQAMITEFDARTRILENAHRVLNTMLWRERGLAARGTRDGGPRARLH